MPSSTSPSMGLFLPIPGTTAGPQWATETTANWSTLDTHDHTTGKGVQIPIAALNVNADFSWLTFGQTNVGYLSLVDKLATGNLTVNASLGNVAGDPYWRNAAGVVKKIGLAGDQLASGTALLGSLLMTAIAAPGSPTAGFGSFYFDSTATNIAVKNSAGVVKHGVQTKAAVGSNWITSIADDGSSVLAQPAFTDISGTVAVGQFGAGVITYAKIQNVSATARVLGRKTAGAGVVEELADVDLAAIVSCGIKIDSGAFASVSSKASTSWSAGKFRRLELHLRVDSGTAGNATMTLTGLTGTYKSYNHFMLGALGAASSATTWVLQNCGPSSQFDLDFQVSTGALRSYIGHGKDTVAEYNIISGGFNSDTTHDVTALTVTFAGASTGYFELIGYP